MIKSLCVQAQALALEPVQTLKASQVQKVTLVALASLVFFGAQLCYSWAMTAGIVLTCSLLTLFSEALLRKDDPQNPNWVNREFDTKWLMKQVAIRLTILPIVLALMTACGNLPLQAVAREIMAGNIRIIFLATVIAPLAEEILFRGFIQERFEDLATLADRVLYPVSETVKEVVSVTLQAFLFGAVHITGEQVVKRSMKLIVFCATSFIGFALGMIKNKDQSLLSPIAIHSAQNTGVVLGLLLGRHQ